MVTVYVKLFEGWVPDFEADGVTYEYWIFGVALTGFCLGNLKWIWISLWKVTLRFRGFFGAVKRSNRVNRIASSSQPDPSPATTRASVTTPLWLIVYFIETVPSTFALIASSGYFRFALINFRRPSRPPGYEGFLMKCLSFLSFTSRDYCVRGSLTYIYEALKILLFILETQPHCIRERPE